MSQNSFRLGDSNVIVGAVLFAGGLGRFLSPLVGASYRVHRLRVKRAALGVSASLRAQNLAAGILFSN